MIVALKNMFETEARTERYNVSRALLRCKMKDGEPLGPHMIKIVGYVQSLERLGFLMSEEFNIDVILNSLPSANGPFISNYHMHGMDKKLAELQGMLKTAEEDIKRGGTNQVLIVQNSKIKKKSWSKKKVKSKGGGKSGSNLTVD